MLFERFLKNKKAVVFTLDDALFPQKDYLLQVYYLFSEFMEYSEQIDSKKVLAFMTKEYTTNGVNAVFTKAAEKFDISKKYEHNFALLHETARLPLKLLLYSQVLALLQEAVKQNIQIFILVEGNPAIAINKIKQIEWNGLEQYLKLYFMTEYDNSCALTVKEMLTVAQLIKEDVVLFTSPIQFESNFCGNQIFSFCVNEVL